MYMSECVIGGGSQILDIVSLSIRVSALDRLNFNRSTYSNLCKSLLILIWQYSTGQGGSLVVKKKK